MIIQKLSRQLAIAGIDHVVVALTKAMDYDLKKLDRYLTIYGDLSENDLEPVWTPGGAVVLVVRGELNRRPFSPVIKTAAELDRYLKALIKTAKEVKEANADEEVEARSIKRVKLHFNNSAERAKARKKAKQYRQIHKSQLKLKAKKYALKMKHKKPNRILSERDKLVHKHFGH